ncbi:MAG: ribosomal protein S18-alanine N-acetyltransferase [Thermoleophilia bacterium]
MSARSEKTPGSALAPHYVLRGMEPADLAAVLEVEAAAFPKPWTRNMFEEELGHPLSWKRVVERDSVQVVGFVISRFYGDVWHVMDLAVAPDHQRRGLAGRLLDEFLGHVPPDTPVVLEVRERNDAALRLYRGRGFREAGRRGGYYSDTDEAALVMVRGPEVCG